MSAPETDPEVGAPPPDVTIDTPPVATISIDAPPAPGIGVPDRVTIDEGSTSSVRASHVEATQAALGRVLAREVRVEQGAVGLVRAERVDVSEGAVGAVAAEQVDARGGFVLLMIARRVSGHPIVLVDWRGLVAFAGVMVVLRRLLRGRR